MSQIIDDADLTYSGDWDHATGSTNLVDGTQSYTIDPAATFSFTFTGTGFDFCAGLKADRGPFSYVIDGTIRGSGTLLGDGMAQDPTCSVVASARNLIAGSHSVVFQNGGSSWFAADAVTVYTGASASSTSSSSVVSAALPTSSVAPATTSTFTSTRTASFVSLTTSSASRSSSSIHSGNSTTATVATQENATHSQLTAGRKAAIIACPILAGLTLAALFFFFVMRYRRSRQERDTAIAPSDSTHWLDEKNTFHDPAQDYRHSGSLDMYEKQYQQPALTPMQALAGRISPIGLGRSNKQGHNRLNSEMSLESHTEPYRPASLVQPPNVEPFYIPPNSESMRASVAPARSALQPPTAAYMYNNRLAAAASGLPEWRESKQSDGSYYAETELPDLPAGAHRGSSHVSTNTALEDYSEIYAGMLGRSTR